MVGAKARLLQLIYQQQKESTEALEWTAGDPRCCRCVGDRVGGDAQGFEMRSAQAHRLFSMQ